MTRKKTDQTSAIELIDDPARDSFGNLRTLQYDECDHRHAYIATGGFTEDGWHHRVMQCPVCWHEWVAWTAPTHRNTRAYIQLPPDFDLGTDGIEGSDGPQ